jgi:hypothetical protein
MPGSLKKMSPQTVAAITPVTRKSNCSITEPMMLASATLKICNGVGLAVVSFMASPPLQAFRAFPDGIARGDPASARRPTTTRWRHRSPTTVGRKKVPLANVRCRLLQMTLASASHSSAATSVAGTEKPFNAFGSLTLAPIDRHLINADLPTAEDRAGSTAATPMGRG